MTLKSFEPFTRLDAADLNSNNEFLQDQTVQPFADSAARGSAIPTPTDGQVTTLADDKNLQTYYGEYRPLPFAVSTGRVTMTGTAATTVATAITFPTGRFTVAPVMTANCSTVASLAAIATGVSSTGATITLRSIINQTFTSTQTADFVSIQMSNGTATG
jgi:hypothetical protein